MSDSNPSTSKKLDKDPANSKSLDLNLSEMDIEFIVKNIGSEWKQLARKLELDKTDVDELEQGRETLKDKAYKMIQLWSQKNGDNATKKKMMDCLTRIECQDIVDELSEPNKELTEDVLEGFKQRVVELYSHLNVPQPPRIDKDISIDSIFIDQHLEVFTLKSPEKPEILHLQSLIQNINKHKMLRTLVEGDPGFGKTTFTCKIATDWAKGRQYISSLFDLVLLIPLREVGNQHLLHFIVDMINETNECTTITVEKLSKYFHQHKVLLLLDGYDELSPESQEKIHPILKKNILKNTYILVTSRRGFFTIKQGATNTSKSLTFQHDNIPYDFWDARVILKGVSEQQRAKVLRDHFGIPTDTLDKTNVLLEDNPWDGLFRCPLFTFWLGWMLETNGHQDIQTRTSFYKHLINLILHKTLVRENEIQEDDAFDAFFLTSTDELTISVQQQINEFGELAMQTMSANKVFFNKSDLKSIKNSILLKSDLLMSYKSVTNQQEQTLYQPMHRSLLEFLVAFHVCYSSKDIHEFKQSISTLLEKGLKPSAYFLLYPFIAGLLEDKAHWLFESLSPWSYKYNPFGSEMKNIFEELKASENDELLQQLLSFVPDYCDFSYLNDKLSSSLIQRLLELAAQKHLISVMKWDIYYPFPVLKITLDKLYVTTRYWTECYSDLDNISIHCKKLIYSIYKSYDKQRCSLKQLLSVCRNITADEIELHLIDLRLKDCDLRFDEIQNEMSKMKLHSVNCYGCELENKHVNALTQLVKSGCITKGITINNNKNNIESDSLSELWESVVESSSITEFTLQDSMTFKGMLIFEMSLPIQLQLLHVQGVRLSFKLVSVNSSIHNFTLLNVANDDNVMNALSSFNHVNYFRCEDWLLARCLTNKVSLLATVTELHLVVNENFSLTPTFIQFMPSLTTFTLNVSNMRKKSIASLEECVISALEHTTTTTTTNSSCAKTKQLKLLGIHFIPSFEVHVFQFFVNCFTKVQSMNLECLELLFENHVDLGDPGFSNTLHELIDLLRNNNITQLNLIDFYKPLVENEITDFVRSCFSEEQIEMKKRFYHNDQQLRLHIPWFYYQGSCSLFYFEVKKRIR